MSHPPRDLTPPAMHGRGCHHPCESARNLAEPGRSVSIHSVEDRRLLAAPRPEPRPVGWISARANGQDGEHQR